MVKISRRVRGEAPLPLILAGAAALTAVLVVIGGALTRTGNGPETKPPETRYIQSLEGVVATYGQRGPSSSSSVDALSTRRSGASRRGGSTTQNTQGIHDRLIASLSSPDILIRRLGHADGDFVYSRSRGWLRFDPSSLALQSIRWTDLPGNLKARYPREIFSDRGRGGQSIEERAGSGGGRSGSDRAGSGAGGRGVANGGTASGSGGSGGAAGGPGSSGPGTGRPGAPGSSLTGSSSDPGAIPGEVVFQTTPRLNPAFVP